MGYTPHVLVVGGGVLGTAIARDLALRGLEVTLVEQGTLSAGTTGRMQGVLYSGARFVEDNPSGATWCRGENRTLRRIADHCVEETGGVVLPAPDEDPAELVATAEQYDLPVSELARGRLEEAVPGVGEEFDRAVQTRDCVVDPFLLTLSNAEGAREYGAEIETGAAVVDLLGDEAGVAGVEIEYRSTTETGREPTTPPESVDREPEDGESDEDDETEIEDGETEDDETETEDPEQQIPGTVQREFPGASADDDGDVGEREEIEADFVVNAAGAWADRIAAFAGIELPLSRTRGRMLVLEGELVDSVVTLRTDGDTLTAVPYQGNTVVGPVGPRDGDDPVQTVLTGLRSAVAGIEDAAILRSYSGVWTQHASSDGPPDGPGTTLVDHQKYDGTWGLLSIVGGTVTTHRLIAEKVVDRVCAEFGIERKCLTEEIPLPGSSNHDAGTTPDLLEAATTTATEGGGDPNPVLCESRSVRRDTVRSVLEDVEEETDLANVRTYTGATMGACQGGRCGHRIAAELYSVHDAETVADSLDDLLETRWQGRREILRGEELGAAMRDYELHARVLGRDRPAEGIVVEPFDDGSDREEDARRRGPPDRSFFEHASDIGFVDPVPRSESGRPMCSEAVVR